MLYQFKAGQSVLDVGCGDDCYEASRLVSRYEFIDLEKTNVDWLDFDMEKGSIEYKYDPPNGWDIIIANDVFPNVDQRLELFLEKYLPHCKEMRLSLTYFDEPHWYRAKRIDGDEVLTMLAWSWWDINDILICQNAEYIDDCVYDGEFSNGRKVWLVWLKGGLA